MSEFLYHTTVGGMIIISIHQVGARLHSLFGQCRHHVGTHPVVAIHMYHVVANGSHQRRLSGSRQPPVSVVSYDFHLVSLRVSLPYFLQDSYTIVRRTIIDKDIFDVIACLFEQGHGTFLYVLFHPIYRN